MQAIKKCNKSIKCVYSNYEHGVVFAFEAIVKVSHILYQMENVLQIASQAIEETKPILEKMSVVINKAFPIQ